MALASIKHASALNPGGNIGRKRDASGDRPLNSDGDGIDVHIDRCGEFHARFIHAPGGLVPWS